MHRTARMVWWGVMLGIAMVPVRVFAADVPAYQNPVCWTRQQCEKAGKDGVLDTHWEEKESLRVDTCKDKDWGHCYAGKRVPLQIHLSTARGDVVKDVADLREYIVLAYVWLVRFAAVLAVVVIMAGGLMWITSAGAGRMDTAKQWIRNAFLGLLLTVGSYVILQTINPDLVRLSLPRTKMIRAVITGQQFCSNLPVDGVEIHRLGPNGPLVTDRTKLACNEIFSVSGASTNSCLGNVCPAGHVCVPGDSAEVPCKAGSFGGVITTDGQAYAHSVRLFGICTSGAWFRTLVIADAEDVTPDHRRQRYFFRKFTDLGALYSGIPCGDSRGRPYVATNPNWFREAVAGFVFVVDIDAEGIDDDFVIGRQTGCGSSNPLVVDGKDDPTDILWKKVSPGEFWSAEEMNNALRGIAPITCSLTLQRTAFRDR